MSAATRKPRRRRRIRQDSEPLPIELIEEGIHLLRRLPLRFWSLYLCGMAPFVVVFLFFWIEMSSSGLAEHYLLPGACVLGLLFLWLKLVQSYFADGIRGTLLGVEPTAWSAGAWLRCLRRQAIWQGSGFFVLPLAALVTLPFPRVFAYYQHLYLMDPRETRSEREQLRESWGLAGIWTEQNWICLALLALVFCLSIVNWLTVLLLVPFLMKTLLGMETVFSQAGVNLVNSTSLFACLLLAYVVTDPLVKAVYLLRHHYCESRRSGADLRLRWRRSLQGARIWSKAASFLFWGGLLCALNCAMSGDLSAAVPAPAKVTVESGELEARIEQTLQQREFIWRFPREEVEDTGEEMNWLLDFWEEVEMWQEKFEHWIENLFHREEKGPKEGRDWDLDVLLLGLGVFLSFLLIGLFVLLVFYLGVKAWRMYQPLELLSGVEEMPEAAVPDLNEEDVAADLLPRNRWIEMARECIARGEYRLALRAYFLAQLSELSSEGVIVIQQSKTNRDYEREIARRAHGREGLLRCYEAQRRLFEGIWYGDHYSGPEQVHEMEGYLGETGVLA
ncbi:hypothetical protein [Coraliomargarita parva]|uniref:hypothetical protein n=1 Tax=Coraliomargarita parva TaxID=3014050 RepID=UPI0022B35EE2|nr:hypothetical protein [Coraliomargarita parva]